MKDGMSLVLPLWHITAFPSFSPAKFNGKKELFLLSNNKEKISHTRE